MATKRSESSPRANRPAKRGRHLPDSKVDFSDVPELSDRQLKTARRVGRPRTGNAKQLIALRIAPSLLATLRRIAKKRGKPYQTLMHEILESAAKGS